MFKNTIKRNQRMSLNGNDPALSSLGAFLFFQCRFARIIYGPQVVQVSGNYNGAVHARNRYGNYTRPYVVPVNPLSARQVVIRDRMTSLSQAWSALTAAQRTAWNEYAANVPVMNRIGGQDYITGANHFIRTNMAAKDAGIVAQISAAPTEFYLGDKDSTLAVTCSAAAQELSVTFDNTKAWAGEVGGKLLIYQGIPVNATHSFFNGPWKLAGSVAGAVVPAVSPAVIACSYPVAAGQKIWIQARTLRADGRLSEPFQCSCTVGA